jgi:hypothetical protein
MIAARGYCLSDKKAPARSVSPYDPSTVARLVKVVTTETGLSRRGDAYDLSQPAPRSSGTLKTKS